MGLEAEVLAGLPQQRRTEWRVGGPLECACCSDSLPGAPCQVWLEHDADWIYPEGPTGHLHDVYFNQCVPRSCDFRLLLCSCKGSLHVGAYGVAAQRRMSNLRGLFACAEMGREGCAGRYPAGKCGVQTGLAYKSFSCGLPPAKQIRHGTCQDAQLFCLLARCRGGLSLRAEWNSCGWNRVVSIMRLAHRGLDERPRRSSRSRIHPGRGRKQRALFLYITNVRPWQVGGPR